MATATELADRLSSFGTSRAEVERELRRIPDLEQRLADAEKRALTDEELAIIATAVDWIRNGNECKERGGTWLRLSSIVARLTPPPPVEWTDVGEGSIAELDGWTIVAWPACDSDKFFSLARKGQGSAFDSDRCKTLDAAKSAAVEWCLKQGAK